MVGIPALFHYIFGDMPSVWDWSSVFSFSFGLKISVGRLSIDFITT